MDCCAAFSSLVRERVLQWLKLLNLVSLLLLGATLAAGNLWVAAARSTIPLPLDAQVRRREVLREKHPGRDDVHLLQLEPGGRLQVDAHVFHAVAPDQRIRKGRWDRLLIVNGEKLQLRWSADFQGMAQAMPLIFGVFLLASGWGWLSMRGR